MVKKKTIINPDLLLKEIEAVRKKGYAINNEEHVIGLMAIAAPIRNIKGETLAAIDVAIPTARLPSEEKQKEIISILKNTASNCSEVIGDRDSL